jgi:uncharacterized protein
MSCHVWSLLKRIGLSVVVGYVLLLAGLWCFQDRLIYPRPGPLLPWGTLIVQRPDLTLHGWVTRPEVPEALVVFGGNNMQVAPVGTVWSHCTEAAIYAMPYRGYEGQAGIPNEKDLVADGVALVRQVQRTHPHVILTGISLGTGVAVQVAAQTHPDRLLLITPYDRLDQVAQDHLPWAPVRWLMRDHFNSIRHLPQLKGIPIAIIQADQDEVIHAARTQALAAAILGGPVAWDHAPTSHNGIWGTPQLCNFLRRQTALPPAR